MTDRTFTSIEETNIKVRVRRDEVIQYTPYAVVVSGRLFYDEAESEWGIHDSSIYLSLIIFMNLSYNSDIFLSSAPESIHSFVMLIKLDSSFCPISFNASSISYTLSKFRGVEICVKATEHGNKVYSVRNDDNAAGYVVIKENKCYINVMGMKTYFYRLRRNLYIPLSCLSN